MGLRHSATFFVLVVVTALRVVHLETYGRWTEALNYPEAYENAVAPNGTRYFACQGRDLLPYDPLLTWWRERCFDDFKVEPRKPRVCNSTPTCCFKTCVLERHEWIKNDKKYDRTQAHAYIQHEYRKHDYPPHIIEDFIDEYDLCAEWYEQKDNENCGKNLAFVKCHAQVFQSVCARLDETLPAPFNDDLEEERPAKKVTPKPTTTTTTTTKKPKAAGIKGRGIMAKITTTTTPAPLQSNHSCVTKCKDLCLARTKFE